MSELASGSEASYDDGAPREDEDVGKCLDFSPEKSTLLTKIEKKTATENVEPVCCHVKGMLSFLQFMFHKQVSPTTINVFAAAISACHDGFGRDIVLSPSSETVSIGNAAA